MRRVPGTTIALLSSPSKMPGYSWGMTARKSCYRANGEICQSCYADKGAYVWKSVRNAYDARYQWAAECMKTTAGRRQFIDTMTAAIGATKNPYFRVHDSGDFLSAAYVECWYEICAALPQKRFWFPTRVWQRPAPQKSTSPFIVMTDADPILTAVRKLATLRNVTVRPSALDFNTPAPQIEGLHAGSTADYSGARHRNCPAQQQNNTCADCRACWNHKKTAITYRKH